MLVVTAASAHGLAIADRTAPSSDPGRPALGLGAGTPPPSTGSLDKALEGFGQRLAETEKSIRLLAEQEAMRSRGMEERLAHQLAEVAWNDRLLLLAVAGAYLWSALLWIELRRASRRLHELSVRSRFDEVFRQLPEQTASPGALDDDIENLPEQRQVPI